MVCHGLQRPLEGSYHDASNQGGRYPTRRVEFFLCIAAVRAIGPTMLAEELIDSPAALALASASLALAIVALAIAVHRVCRRQHHQIHKCIRHLRTEAAAEVTIAVAGPTTCSRPPSRSTRPMRRRTRRSTS